MITSTLNYTSRDVLMRRHFPYGAHLTALLTRIANAADAANLLEDPPAFAAGTILQLPAFVHVNYCGASSPNCIRYDTTTVVFAKDDTAQEISYEIPNSQMPSQLGTIRLIANTYGSHRLDGEIPDMAPAGYATPLTVTEVTSAAAARTALRRIMEDGKLARFELAQALQPYTARAVNAAACAVYSEVANLSDAPDAACIPAVDDSDQERIVTELLYGREGSADSVVLRMIDRAACTDWALGKHVSRRMAQSIWSAAETAVRRSIDDPHIGRLVRSMARRFGISNPTELLQAFRDKYPTRRVGIGRIRRSLEVGDLYSHATTGSSSRVELVAAKSSPSSEPPVADLWAEVFEGLAA